MQTETLTIITIILFIQWSCKYGNRTKEQVCAWVEIEYNDYFQNICVSKKNSKLIKY